jgi:hypothetical protein
MRPDELSKFLLSMSLAADVVEAIDRPALQWQRGWNLANWTYDLVPWGVRFHHHDGPRNPETTVVAVALPENLRGTFGNVYTDGRERTSVLMLG